MTIQIYHNPRCSKSRQTLALLEENNITPDVIEYLKTTPTAQEVNALITKLGFESARQLMRTKEDLYKELNLKDETNEDALINAMTNNPKLIERPIVINGDKAAIGRPPESILDII
ncbi:arsenate reductase (glutaredoxin) [Pseudoalteromonas denitrificans]|uniref:Arsenate reductase n=1 Tax=Pseudoalteromonas denitrificans DSM 6059 TaxID=1123010 RepID=A0A1I1KX21_9GAMM|nr:arsenate reductase (glutaredoxin) [Pseudoalteromonas denitrificans]SFC65344.1 arsenate reductase [Pseudoalteromonas denitrificans DSM 6059]